MLNPIRTSIGLMACVLFCTFTNPVDAQNVGNKIYHAGPQSCGVKAATTALAATAPNTVAAYQLIPAATNNLVGQLTTNTTAGTVQVTCDVMPPGQQLNGPQKGVQIVAISLYYGVQTTALASIATASLSTVTYPVSTAAGAAAAGTVAAAITLGTVTPTSLQLTTTTSGACFNERIPLASPTFFNTENQSLTLEQVFTTAGSTATALQICDVIVYYNETIF